MEPDTPLLWVLRDTLGLTGTKYGCGIAQCGACTVHIDGVAVRSCSIPVGAVTPTSRSPPSKALPRTAAASGAEGLDRPRRAAMRLLPERNDHGGGGAAQATSRKPTDADIDAAITNICRCGTYQRIRAAIHDAALERLRERTVAMTSPQIDRRSLLASVAAAGGALVLGFEFPFGPMRRTPPRAQRKSPPGSSFEPDDSVTLRHPRKSEMGQGSSRRSPCWSPRSSNATGARCRRSSSSPHENLVRNRIWGDMSTGGSRAIRSSQEFLRKAGATAREMLIAAAAKAMERRRAPSAAAENSVITHGPGGRIDQLRQGRCEPPPSSRRRRGQAQGSKDWRLARQADEAARDQRQGAGQAALWHRRAPARHALRRADPVPRIQGQAQVDRRLASQWHAGVRKVVKLPNAVAVVADSHGGERRRPPKLCDRLGRRRQRQQCPSDSIRDFVRTGLPHPTPASAARNGNVVEGLAKSVKRIEAEYYAAVPASRHDGAAELHGRTWSATRPRSGSRPRTPKPRSHAAAQALGVPPRNVVLHPDDGRRRLRPARRRRRTSSRIAVLIAKEIGRAGAKHMVARRGHAARLLPACRDGKDDSGAGRIDGMPIAWHVRLAGTIDPRDAPTRSRSRMASTGISRRASSRRCPMTCRIISSTMPCATPHVPVGFGAAVNHTQNDFFKECFIDETGACRRPGPLHYRRKIARQPSRTPSEFLAVLDAAANQGRLGARRRRRASIAASRSTKPTAASRRPCWRFRSAKAARCACIASCARSIPATSVNPMTIEMQTESSDRVRLTAALYGEITIKDGRVEQSNFHDYQMLRLARCRRSKPS